MTIFYANWPRVIPVEPWSRLRTYNAGFKDADAILVADVSGAAPVAELDDERDEVRP